jgi:hypothetical protein
MQGIPIQGNNLLCVLNKLLELPELCEKVLRLNLAFSFSSEEKALLGKLLRIMADSGKEQEKVKEHPFVHQRRFYESGFNSKHVSGRGGAKALSPDQACCWRLGI